MNKSSSTPAAPRTTYSTEEVVDIYALGKMWLETGQLRRAEVVMQALNKIAPDFFPAWLGSAVVLSTQGDLEGVQVAARQALKLNPQSAEAMMFLVMAALGLRDMSTAGTFLGEVGELIEQGSATDPNLVRLYKMQLARYQGMER